MLTVLNKYLEPSALADECVVGRWILSLNEEERNTFAKLKEHSNSVKLAALYKDLLSEGLLPFKLTAFRSHLRSYCTCQN